MVSFLLSKPCERKKASDYLSGNDREPVLQFTMAVGLKPAIGPDRAWRGNGSGGSREIFSGIFGRFIPASAELSRLSTRISLRIG
jgi:hypothetical protein